MAIGIGFWNPGALLGFGGWQAAAVTGFIAGGVATSSVSGAFIGAFSAAAFYGIGQKFRALSKANVASAQKIGNLAGQMGWDAATHTKLALGKFVEFGGNYLTGGQVAAQIASHAIAGGVIAVARGGKFGHGFASAGVTKGLGGAFLPGGGNLSSGEVAKGAIVSAIIGGTASSLSGGKFANGAQTATFQHLFNALQKHYVASRKRAVHNAIVKARVVFRSLQKVGSAESRGRPTQGTYVYEDYESCGIFCSPNKADKRFWSDNFANANGSTFRSLHGTGIAGLGGPSCGRECRVSDWILATDGNVLIDLDYYNRVHEIESVYIWSESTDLTNHYTRNGNSWSCTVHETGGAC